MDLSVLGEAWKIWFIAAIIFFIIEGSSLGTFSLFFGGVGASITSAICFVSPLFASSGVFQVLTFSGATLLSLYLLRPILVRLTQNDAKFSGSDFYVGKQARTLTVLSKNNFDGRVFYEGTEWPAMLSEEHHENIPADSAVEIVKMEGLTLHVKPRKT